MNTSEQGPLARFSVVEVGQGIPVPFCGKLLADLGAQVIKVEPPQGDVMRRYGPFPGDIPHSERSGLFLYLNTSKLGVTLDLEKPTGRDLLSQLLEKADVLLHDVGPASESPWRPEYGTLAGENPGLVVTAITVFGLRGPHAHYQGGSIQAVAGSVAYHLGDPDREPLVPPAQEGAYWGGIQGCAATLVALFARENTGQGQEVDISSLESLSTLLNAQRDLRAVKYGRSMTVGFGGDTPRQGYHGWLLPWVTLPCKDGYVVVMSSSVRHWQRYLDLMEGEDWTQDPRIRELDRDYIENDLGFDTLDAYQMGWLEQHTRKELLDMFGRIRVPFQPVQTMDEVVESDHLAHRGYFVEMEHPVAGQVKMPGIPFQLPRSPWQSKPAPQLGEHNQQVYCEMLGLSQRELVQLQQEGVV